ncbi:uncharacterized protein LOC124646008 [Helicoverpa zea]|uniref:uncharacterized protein LOC124630020 n=1 Tax=Helicoverpa zea TaxID=7113 RepID=UPI001F58DD98|nr:uncharacterized protein LOC124630020 [Helicoverpa zea]XP_047041980.1 uncharacterized protein LOC124646008 [Helicoverpa zea]
MKTCAVCNDQFNDGVQCASCRKHLDFSCANVSEVGWRRLGVDRRAQWKCPGCRAPSPVLLSPQPPASLDTILSEVRDMKRQLLDLPSLIHDLRSIKEELSELKKSYDFSSSRLDDFDSRIGALEAKASQLGKLQDTVSSLQAEVASTKLELSSHDQRSRLNNVEIKGIPLKKDENLFLVVDSICRKIKYSCDKTLINYISRVPIRKSKDKLLVVSFLNRYVKEDFVAAARAVKDLSTADLGFQGAPQRIYVNDHLSVESKMLLNKTKSTAKDKCYEFVWVKHGKIHVRKDVNCKPFIVRRETDLNKII